MNQTLFDISETNELILFNASIDENYNRVPYELTLSEFMTDSRWEAVPDSKATGEYKGQYYLRQPDGEMWRGGWIGKNRSGEDAKRQFHKKQIYWAIHRGQIVSSSVLHDYPKYKISQDLILQTVQKIQLDEGEYGWMKVNGVKQHFYIKDFPLFSRVSGRGFVRSHQLIDDSLPGSGSLYTSFDSMEITTIAMELKLKDRLKKDYRPHFSVDGFFGLDSGDQVTFELVEDIDEQGRAVHVQEFNGKIIYNAGSDFKRIEYKDVYGDIQRRDLQPSECKKIRK